ncbi:hypothetical protein K2173_023607 [Erythroxylum novogranatense]|uniref:Autophagy protein 5 n=1 Tax=Erythroxylum novogranatense TaxID=1862640 RepID=A0AAV8TPJ0_9ROSI|nr:hypothetical protein K2173_023607 [Erythroxylum novogranatense]
MKGQSYVWEGAIPLQIHLHESEVTTMPAPAPALVLAPRIGYLPLLLPLVKPHFASALPPGVDTPWFDYKGLPLKWYVPTGVLFDLLCHEPERPWNLTVHFRGYPNNLLMPYEGEDSVKWNFINSLKEADYIINGNCKNVMHMSQSDQLELWRSVMNGSLEAYLRASSKLRLGTVEDEYTLDLDLCKPKSPKTSEVDVAGQVKAGKVPVRLYIWTVSTDFEDLEDVPNIDSWDKISYVNRPVEFLKEEGRCFTLLDALKTLLPEFFNGNSMLNEEPCGLEDEEDKQNAPEEDSISLRKAKEGKETSCQIAESCRKGGDAEIKLVRIQGIEPKLEIPFSWIVNNLKNPEHFLHICLYLKLPIVNTA